MALSERGNEDKAKLKSGVMGVGVLLVIGIAGPVIIGEFTGVDVNDLQCEEVDDSDDQRRCIENAEIGGFISEAMSYIMIIIALVSMAGFLIVGIKY